MPTYTNASALTFQQNANAVVPTTNSFASLVDENDEIADIADVISNIDILDQNNENDHIIN